MGAHIIKRRPPGRLPQTAALHQTAEFTEKQLDELLLQYAHERLNHAHDDLEADLELVDPFPEVFPEATPTGLPRASSLRFAHTLRRAAQLDVGPDAKPALTTQPAPAPPLPAALVERTGSLTPEMPDTARSATPSTAGPSMARPASVAPETTMSWVSEPALATPEAAPSQAAAMHALSPAGAVPGVLPSVADTPRRSFLFAAGRVCLVFLVLFLLTLGAAALLLQ